MPNSYSIKIFSPVSTTDVIEEISSESPFMAISRGDQITTNGTGAVGWLKVGDIAHFVFVERGQVSHEIHVFTEFVRDQLAESDGITPELERQLNEKL